MKPQPECSMYITVVSTHTHLEPTKHLWLKKKTFDHEEKQEQTDADELAHNQMLYIRSKLDLEFFIFTLI